jgi:hypothetical protein
MTATETESSKARMDRIAAHLGGGGVLTGEDAEWLLMGLAGTQGMLQAARRFGEEQKAAAAQAYQEGYMDGRHDILTQVNRKE